MKCEHGKEVTVLIEPTPYWQDGIKEYTYNGQVAHSWKDQLPHYLKVEGCPFCQLIQIKQK